VLQIITQNKNQNNNFYFGLFIKVWNDEVSDTTGDDSSGIAGNKKN
jgi:hypothetical protein